MKLALVRRGYSPTGGAERYLLRFADSLRQSGHEAILFTTSDWPADSWKGDLIRVDGRSPRHFADSLQKARPRDHADLVFSLDRVWDCDAYRAGDGVHKAWLERRRPFEPPWKPWFRALQPKHRELLELERSVFDPIANRLIIANSKMVAAEITRHFRLPPDHIRVIYNGLPSQRMGNIAHVRDHEGTCVILFTGSGWHRKGLRFAIQALNQIKDATLLVAGSGKRTGLPSSPRTQFLGPVKEMQSLLESSDLFLLPTLYDPFSNASLEAMAAGLPVITTQANGFAEIMRPAQDGEVLSDPSDIGAMVSAIEKWRIEDPASRDSRRQHAAHYTIEENVRQTLAALTSR
jgi:UDP-glucose:(heptosyl)LPS alpha-1,3-glucosyltransferase